MYIKISYVPSSVLNKLFLKNKQLFYTLQFYYFLNFGIDKLYFKRSFFDLRITLQFFIFIFYFFKKSNFFRFTSLIDIGVVDLLSSPRFLLNYFLLSVFFSMRLCISCFVNELSMVPSLTYFFGSSN
jgi:hypothetical protein